MGGRHIFLLTYLPALDEPGSQPPLTLADLLAIIKEEQVQGLELVEAVLLEHDLIAFQGASRENPPTPVVLVPAQIAGEEALPAYLTVEPAGRLKLPGDALWEAYSRHLHALGQASGSGLLVGLAAFEIALKNQLAAARAARLGLDVDGYFVAEELGQPSSLVAEAVSAWESAPGPLAAEKALDERRWRWLALTEPYYSFAFDEVLGYARKLLLLWRWRRIAAAAELKKDRTQSSGG